MIILRINVSIGGEGTPATGVIITDHIPVSVSVSSVISSGAQIAATGETPYGAPARQIGNVSGEARLMPKWGGLWRISEALV